MDLEVFAELKGPMPALFDRIVRVHEDETLAIGPDLAIRPLLATQQHLIPIQRANGAEDKLTPRTQIFICEMLYRALAQKLRHKAMLGFERAGIFPFNSSLVLEYCTDFTKATEIVKLNDDAPARPTTRRSLSGSLKEIADTFVDPTISPKSKLRTVMDTAARALETLQPPSLPSRKRQLSLPDITTTQRTIDDCESVEELKARLKEANEAKAAKLESKMALKRAKKEVQETKKKEVAERKAARVAVKEEREAAKVRRGEERAAAKAAKAAKEEEKAEKAAAKAALTDVKDGVAKKRAKKNPAEAARASMGAHLPAPGEVEVKVEMMGEAQERRRRKPRV